MTAIRFLLAMDQEGVLSSSVPPPGFPEALAVCDRATLAYLAEGHLLQALDRFRSAGLPEPDFLACDSGTALYRRSEDTYVLDGDYRREVMESFGAVDPSSLRNVMAGTFPQLGPQEFDQQGEFKLAYFIDGWKEFQEIIASIRLVLRHMEARVRLVMSVRPGDGRGYLVMLPERYSRTSPLERVGALSGLGPERVVYVTRGSVCDPAALEGGHACILLPDEDSVDVEALTRRAAANGARLYVARTGGGSGLLEGCRALGLLEDAG